MSLSSELSAPRYGLAEAARVCGVSKPTVRRRKDALVSAGATADEAGWQIPVSALIEVGLLETSAAIPLPPRRSRVSARTDTPVTPVTTLPRRVEVASAEIDNAELRVAELEAELVAVRRQLAVATARTEERDRCLLLLEAALAAMTDPPVDRRTVPWLSGDTPNADGTRSTGPWRSPSSWTHPTQRRE